MASYGGERVKKKLGRKINGGKTMLDLGPGRVICHIRPAIGTDQFARGQKLDRWIVARENAYLLRRGGRRSYVVSGKVSRHCSA